MNYPTMYSSFDDATRQLLLGVEDSSVSQQRRSDLSRHPARGPHRICARPRRPSSPLLPNLVFSTHRMRLYHVVGVLEVHGMPAVEQLRGEWRNRDCSVDRSVVEGDGVLREGKYLDLDVVESEPVALEELADLIGRHRALAVGGDGLIP